MREGEGSEWRERGEKRKRKGKEIRREIGRVEDRSSVCVSDRER